MEGKGKICISTISSMSDQKITISLKDLKPHKMVTLKMSVTTDDGYPFASFAHFKADSFGCVDVSRDPSHGGSYRGIDQMGLFTSLECSQGLAKKLPRFHKIDVESAMRFQLELFDDQINRIEECVDSSDKCHIKRWYLKPNFTIERLDYSKDGIHASIFVPPGSGKYPGVIVMFGGLPGLLEFKASLLASHGFVAMALAFHGAHMKTYWPNPETGLPQSDLAYFRQALEHLRSHPRVSSPNGIGLISISFSVHIALLMATYLSGIGCCVCINGYIWSAGINYDLDGDKLPCEPKDDFFVRFQEHAARLKEGEPFVSVDFYPKITSEQLRSSPGYIDYPSRKDVAYMMIAGDDDKCLPADNYARVFGQLLEDHPNHVELIYEGAGHLIEPPYAPLNCHTRFQGRSMIWGGRPKQHAYAQLDSWQRQIEFLNKNLSQNNDLNSKL